MKHIRHVPESCLRHCIEGVSNVNVDLVDSLFLFVSFIRFWDVDVYTSTLLTSTLSRA